MNGCDIQSKILMAPRPRISELCLLLSQYNLTGFLDVVAKMNFIRRKQKCMNLKKMCYSRVIFVKANTV